MVPSQGYVNISRRPPDFQDYLDILRRYRSWILGPVFAGLVIAVVVAFIWPDTYVSRATMQITPQQVPERIVPSIINSQIGERLTQMQQGILSRNSLTELIQKHGLYQKDQKKKPMEDVIEKMKRNVHVTLLDMPSSAAQANGRQKIASAFQIEFSYPDRYKAQAVVGALVTRFMDQNVQVTRSQSALTTSFLNDEAQQAKAELDRLDKEITQFRVSNTGKLPEQLNVNITAMNSLQMQLASVTEALNRAEQDKMMLETSLQNLKSQLNLAQSSASAPSTLLKNERLQLLSKTIQDQETALNTALERYTPDHPDVKSAQAQLVILRKERDALARQEQQEAAKHAENPRITNPQILKSIEDYKGAINSTLAQIKAKTLDIQEHKKQQAQIQNSMKTYQARIEVAPLNETRYTILDREYKLAKAKYEDLMIKKGLSETAKNMDERKAGENLAVLDDASLPEKPSEPNRLMIIGMGAGMGLMLGVFLAGAKEMKDTSLKNLKDVRAYTNLAVLTSIPLLENALVLRRKRRMFWLAWSCAIIVGTIAMSGSMYLYYFGRS